jgi:arylsulfatase A
MRGALAVLAMVLVSCAGPTGPTVPTAAAVDVTPTPSRPPNIVLIIADDLGYGDLSSYGGPVHTPNVDALAAGGARLTDWYVTAPICAPSRASIYTGRWPVRTGVTWCVEPPMPLRPEEITIAEELKAGGYRTALLGKWHLGSKDAAWEMPLAHGFDTYWGLDHENGGFVEGSKRITDVALEGVSAETLARARAFVASGSDPFLLVIATRLPHLPSVPAPQFAGTTHSPYYDTVRELDWLVGETMAIIRDAGLEQDTVTVFTSDNGPIGIEERGGSAGPFGGRKQGVREGGIRVPGIIHAPGRVAPGRVITTPTQTVDLFPTIVAMTSRPLPARDYDGVDLAPVLAGGSLPARDLVFFLREERAALRSGNWKLIRGEGLFDLSADPGETTDLSSGRPDVLAQLEERL